MCFQRSAQPFGMSRLHELMQFAKASSHSAGTLKNSGFNWAVLKPLRPSTSLSVIRLYLKYLISWEPSVLDSMTQCFPVQSLSNKDAENRVTNKIAERPCLASLFASNHPSCGQNYPKVRFLLKRAIQVNLTDTWVLNRKSETSNSVVLEVLQHLEDTSTLQRS